MADLPSDMQAKAIDGACGGDAVLRAEVERLLRAEGEAGGVPTSPTGDATADLASGASVDAAAFREHPGSRIGAHTLLQLIGEGGFGSVYLAEPAQPVQRRVALKIIKMGMDTRQVIARLEVEPDRGGGRRASMIGRAWSGPAGSRRRHLQTPPGSSDLLGNAVSRAGYHSRTRIAVPCAGEPRFHALMQWLRPEFAEDSVEWVSMTDTLAVEIATPRRIELQR
ncbi:MAG: hypothetical protein KF817_05645 [Phycisphaeraceae bacterium]|nr:hypothetical protein [Phycisphaeraceae bacterium]